MRSSGENFSSGAAPWYDSYLIRDGKYVVIGAVEPRGTFMRVGGVEPERTGHRP